MHRLIALTALLATSVGCGISYERNVEPTFVRSCAAVECHSGDPADESGLDLSQGNGYGQIVGQASEQSDLPLIDPGNPDGSYLWHKINGTHVQHEDPNFDTAGTGTDPMPPVGSLSVNELSNIEKWITDGAPE